MAAISAARNGAETLLIERSNCSGGIWTSGLLSWMLDVKNKNGLLKELLSALKEQENGYYSRYGCFIAYPESVKMEL